jgi:4-hydroxy-tetrahydrodipicolinate reductase
MSDMRLIILGAAGRMGRTLTRIVTQMDGVEVAGAVEQPQSPHLGTDVGELAGVGSLGVPITDDLLPLVVNADGILDFTVPVATLAAAELAAQGRVVHVIGTTGFDGDEEARIAAAGRHATIIKSGNMSLGINLLAGLARQAAQALGSSFDVEIVEMHHRHKVDAPSGTAKLLGQAVADGLGIDLDQRSIRSRDGNIGPRPRSDIGFATLRGGSVVGDHSIILAGEGERIELIHRAQDRDLFARGGVTAALWGHGRKPGLYSMADLLGLAKNCTRTESQQ